MIAKARNLGARFLTRLHQRVMARHFDVLAIDVQFEKIVGHTLYSAATTAPCTMARGSLYWLMRSSIS